MTASSSTRERLVAGALAVVSRHGYRGATTREIAAEAGVSEVTLFRHFGSKAELVGEALTVATEPFRSGAATYTGDLNHDLEQLAAGYLAFIDTWPALFDRVLPEIISDPELGPSGRELLAGNAKLVEGLIGRYQDEGQLVDCPLPDLIRAFLGPLLARAALRHVLPVNPLDPAEYAERFLEGYRA